MSSEYNGTVTREALIDMLQSGVRGAITGIMNNEKPTPSCLSCCRFKEATEICMQYNKRPPARVIAHGCPAYIDVLEVPY